MTRDQFTEFLKRIRQLFPDTFAWLQKKQSDCGTLTVWYDEMFCDLDPDICNSALMEIWRKPDQLQAYDREKLPSIIRGIYGEISFRRAKQERAAEERAIALEGQGSFWSDASMKQAVIQATKLNYNRRLRRCFIDQYFEDDAIWDVQVYAELHPNVHDDLTQDDCTPGIAHYGGRSALRSWENERRDGVSFKPRPCVIVSVGIAVETDLALPVVAAA